jgi:hypothetical protein
MVPVQTPEMQGDNPLRVCVEAYNKLPLDSNAVKAVIQDAIKQGKVVTLPIGLTT